MNRLFLLLLLPLVQAHKPAEGGTDVTVEDPTISWVLVFDAREGTEVFTVNLSYEQAFAAPFQVLVPHRGDEQALKPAYAVIGPGLPAPTAEELEALPVELAEGEGAFVDLGDGEWTILWEAVLRRVYWSGPVTAVPMGAGDSRVVLWVPDGTPGEFSLGFGVEEDFSEGAGGLFKDWGIYAW